MNDRLLAILIRCCGAFLALVLVISLGQTAKAANVDSLLGCNRADHAVERNDGSLIVLGTTRNCGFDAYLASPNRWQALVGLNADGSIRGEFGQGGVVLGSMAEHEYVLDMIDLDGGELLVLTNRRLRSYASDGSLRQSFGADGQIVPLSLASLNAQPTGIAATSDGGFLLGAAHRDRGALVAAFDQNGQAEESFGTDGVLEVGMSGGASLTIDSTDRVLVAGGGWLKRYSSTGVPDEGFNAGAGTAAFPAWGIHDISLLGDGRISVIVGGWDGLYAYPAYTSIFDPDGVPLGAEPGEYLDSMVQAAVAYSGGVLFSRAMGRYSDPTFTLGNPGNFGSRTYEFSPGAAIAYGFAALRDGSMLALGKSEGPGCEAPCGIGAGMAIVKIDSQTGEPVATFGHNGEMLIPANRCPHGSAGSIDAWQKCRVEAPDTDGVARLFHRRATKPQASLRATLGTPPSDLWGTRQRFEITLPDGVGMTGKAKRRIRVSTAPYTPFETKLRPRGLSIVLSPEYLPWQGWWDGFRGYDRLIELKVELRQGAIRKIRPKALRKRPWFLVKGTFVPVKGGMAGSQARVWFAPNSKTVRIRAGR